MSNTLITHHLLDANYSYLRSTHLSLDAVGLLGMMLYFPEGREFSVSALGEMCADDETAIRSTLKELENWGYLKVTKKNNGRGFEYTYEVFDFSTKDSHYILGKDYY